MTFRYVTRMRVAFDRCASHATGNAGLYNLNKLTWTQHLPEFQYLFLLVALTNDHQRCEHAARPSWNLSPPHQPWKFSQRAISSLNLKAAQWLQCSTSAAALRQSLFPNLVLRSLILKRHLEDERPWERGWLFPPMATRKLLNLENLAGKICYWQMSSN